MKIFSRLLALSVIAFLVTACSSSGVERVKYYQLAVPSVINIGTDDVDTRTRVVIDEVQLPRFLKQDNMVIQLEGNEIYTANSHRWAEPLNEAISKLLVSQLNTRDSHFRFERSAGEWNRGAPIHLRLEFIEFHPMFGKEVVVSGRLWFYDGNRDLKVDQSFRFVEPMAGEGYDYSVKALQKSVDHLSDQINKAASTIDWSL